MGLFFSSEVQENASVPVCFFELYVFVFICHPSWACCYECHSNLLSSWNAASPFLWWIFSHPNNSIITAPCWTAFSSKWIIWGQIKRINKETKRTLYKIWWLSIKWKSDGGLIYFILNLFLLSVGIVKKIQNPLTPNHIKKRKNVFHFIVSIYLREYLSKVLPDSHSYILCPNQSKDVAKWPSFYFAHSNSSSNAKPSTTKIK